MVVGLGAQLCTLLEVWVLGVGMSTLHAQTALYAEERGLQVPMVMEVDHTDFFKWLLKHSFIRGFAEKKSISMTSGFAGVRLLGFRVAGIRVA